MSLAILNVTAPRTNTAGVYATEQTAATTDTTTDPKKVGAESGMLDRDAFLKLLVAQLKYQDPSKPMDASAMIAQSAQLTMVDKLDNISTMLEASALTGRLGLAGSLIGKEITFTSEEGVVVKDVVTSVRFADDGSLILHTPDWDVPMDVVTAIGAPTTVPEATDPAATTPAGTTPATTTPATTPAGTTPAATTPAGTTPATTTPATTTPAATTPATTTPATTTPAATTDPVVP